MKEIAKKVKLSQPVDIDTINIKRDLYFSSAYIIDLPLDSTPDHIWQDIFEWEWKSSRYLWDRKLFVIGDKLRLVTTANGIEEKLIWVEQVIERTNEGIDEYNREVEARSAEIEEEMRRNIEEEKLKGEIIREVLRKRFKAF